MQTTEIRATPAAKPRDSKREQFLNQVIRPKGCPKGVNPHTGLPLRPGQRLPRNRDAEEALQKRCLDYFKELDEGKTTYPQGSFPIGPQWELISEIVERWKEHQFQGRRGDTNYFRGQGDLSEGEWSQFVWDLLCWLDLDARGLMDRPLHEYLSEGRENWGISALALDFFRPGWREQVRRRRGGDDGAEGSVE